MLTKTSIPVVLLLVLATAYPALAADESVERQTLKGIKMVAVQVEALRPEVEGDGLTQAQIKADVEQRLREAGIQVNDGATATLIVNVNAVLVGQGAPVYAVSAQVEFEQDVVVRGLDATARTRSIGGIAAVGKANLPMVRDLRARQGRQVHRRLSLGESQAVTSSRQLRSAWSDATRVSNRRQATACIARSSRPGASSRS